MDLLRNGHPEVNSSIGQPWVVSEIDPWSILYVDCECQAEKRIPYNWFSDRGYITKTPFTQAGARDRPRPFKYVANEFVHYYSCRCPFVWRRYAITMRSAEFKVKYISSKYFLTISVIQFRRRLSVSIGPYSVFVEVDFFWLPTILNAVKQILDVNIAFIIIIGYSLNCHKEYLFLPFCNYHQNAQCIILVMVIGNQSVSDALNSIITQYLPAYIKHLQSNVSLG